MSPALRKTLLFLAVLGAALAFFTSDLPALLTLEGLKAGLARFQEWRATSPWTVSLGYFALYVLVTALSVPGAVVMTLAGGALFGLLWGTVLISLASTLGATLAFWTSRYLLHDFVQRRWGKKLAAINEGVARDGAFYLFTLRLVPIFPFFLINLLMGLVPMRAFTFFWVSQVGMLAGTLVYVNAGTQLARIDSLSGILSAPVLLSFVLLGVFPLLAQALLRAFKRRRVYARWTRPAKFDRNLVVIGAGAAGLVSAYIAAAVKAKVTLIEARKMGGDCLNTGCVPSKALLRAARLAHEMRHADRYGLVAASPRVDFRAVLARVQEVVRRVAPHDSIERYTALGVEVLTGFGKLVDPWTVEVALADGDTRRLTTRSIIIAAGARPFVPPLPGLEAAGFVTSDTLWDDLAAREHAPQSVIVLGGGPIGCELTQALARLGSSVTLVEMAPRLLLREDEEVSDFVRQVFAEEGITVFTGHRALRCEVAGEALAAQRVLVVEHEGRETRLAFDLLVCAVGRVARLEGYGLETLGVPAERTVLTNEYLETLYPNIFAAGDVAGPYQFTHNAAHQAWHAAVNALFGRFKRFKVDYSTLPWTTFIDPEVARVGLNELEARERGIAHEVTRYGIDELDRAIAEGNDRGWVKVLTEPGRDRILGVTIVGAHAGEMLAEFVLAMRHGLGLNKILATIHTYPTFAEANKFAAGEWKRTHAPRRLLTWLGRFFAWQRG